MKFMFSAKIQQFTGSWKQVETHGLNEFLEAQGIGWIKRKVAVKCNPVDNIQVDHKSITIAYTGNIRDCPKKREKKS